MSDKIENNIFDLQYDQNQRFVMCLLAHLVSSMQNGRIVIPLKDLQWWFEQTAWKISYDMVSFQDDVILGSIVLTVNKHEQN